MIESHTFFPNSGPHTDAVFARLGGLDSGLFNTHDDHNDHVTLSRSHWTSGDGRVQILSGEPSPQPLILGQTYGSGLSAPEEISVERTKQFSVSGQCFVSQFIASLLAHSGPCRPSQDQGKSSATNRHGARLGKWDHDGL